MIVLIIKRTKSFFWDLWVICLFQIPVLNLVFNPVFFTKVWQSVFRGSVTDDIYKRYKSCNKATVRYVWNNTSVNNVSNTCVIIWKSQLIQAKVWCKMIISNSPWSLPVNLQYKNAVCVFIRYTSITRLISLQSLPMLKSCIFKCLI